jgi:hypothetical protein
MRPTRLALAWRIFFLAGTVTAIVGAADAPQPHPDSLSDDSVAHERSRQVFERGVHLYQQGNMVGALAEFEAAYAIHPNSAALQDIALCQKALYRYREAKASLELLLARHDYELSPLDRKTALNVMAELADFVGQVRITVNPANSRVTIDDREVSPAELEMPLELNVGEHRLRAEAEGFAPTQQTIAVAGGLGNSPVLVTLSPTHAYLTVLTPDDRTAIAIDGRAVAFESYRGYVEPGRHVIQVYRSGFEPYEAVVELQAGQSTTIHGKVGPALSESEAEEQSDSQRPPLPPPRQLRGWYGLLEGSLSNWTGAPQDVDSNDHPISGYGYGLRAGYRLFTPVGVEAVAGLTHHAASGTCAASGSESICQTPLQPSSIDYTLDSRRVGGALRIMSGGESVRFTSTVGVGTASHDLHLAGNLANNLKSKTLKGFDAYFALEAGAQVNIDHLLVEMVGFGWFDSASSIQSWNNYSPYQAGNGIQMFGVSLRIGWSEWTPRDAHVNPNR